MPQALILNVLILGMILVGIVLTHSPLFLLGLLGLLNLQSGPLMMMPSGLDADTDDTFDDPDHQNHPIGFTAGSSQS